MPKLFDSQQIRSFHDHIIIRHLLFKQFVFSTLVMTLCQIGDAFELVVVFHDFFSGDIKRVNLLLSDGYVQLDLPDFVVEHVLVVAFFVHSLVGLLRVDGFAVWFVGMSSLRLVCLFCWFTAALPIFTCVDLC